MTSRLDASTSRGSLLAAYLLLLATGGCFAETANDDTGSTDPASIQQAVTLPNPTVVGDPVSYVRSDGRSAVLYILPTSGRIIELSQYAGQWTRTDLSAATNAPPVYFNSRLTAYKRSDNVDAVVYIDNIGHVRELYRAGGAWQLADLTWIVGGPPAVGEPSAFKRSDNVNSVIFKSAGDGEIHELYLNTSINKWRIRNLSAISGAPDAEGSPFGYVRGDGVKAIVYRDHDSHIREITLSGSSGAQIHDLTTNVSPVAPLASDWGNPRAYVRHDGVTSVVYIEEDAGHIIELALTTSGWRQYDLTAEANAPAGSARTLAPFARHDGVSSIAYREIYGPNIRELYLLNGQWTDRVLAPTPNAPPVTDFPTAYRRADGANAVVWRNPIPNLPTTGHMMETIVSRGTPLSGSLTVAAGGTL